MNSLLNYFRDTAAEMKQVAWPTQAQAINYTLLVIAISAFVSVFTGGFDYIFTQFIDFIINAV